MVAVDRWRLAAVRLVAWLCEGTLRGPAKADRDQTASQKMIVHHAEFRVHLPAGQWRRQREAPKASGSCTSRHTNPVSTASVRMIDSRAARSQCAPASMWYRCVCVVHKLRTARPLPASKKTNHHERAACERGGGSSSIITTASWIIKGLRHGRERR